MGDRSKLDGNLDSLGRISRGRYSDLFRFVLVLIAATMGLNCASAQVHFTFVARTGNNATVVLPTTANPNIAGNPLAPGDEIGAFAPAGFCVGAVEWAGSNTAIAVWGDNEQTPGIDGIRSGEAITYRVWKKSTNTEYPKVGVAYSSGSGIYQPNGLFVLSSFSASLGPAANVDEIDQVPDQVGLEQNYPNPFNPSTRIRYKLAKEGKVLLEVYDLLGHRVETLFDGERTAGVHEIEFNANAIPSGIYFYALRQGEHRATRRFQLVR